MKETVRYLSHSWQQVSDLIGADPREIIFTSGATESNNMAIKVLPSAPTLCHYFSIPSRSSTLVSFRVQYEQNSVWKILTTCGHIISAV